MSPRRVKAIHFPSGENLGKLSTSAVVVSLCAGPPLRGAVHKSPAWMKAILWREMSGWRNSRAPEGPSADSVLAMITLRIRA